MGRWMAAAGIAFLLMAGVASAVPLTVTADPSVADAVREVAARERIDGLTVVPLGTAAMVTHALLGEGAGRLFIAVGEGELNRFVRQRPGGVAIPLVRSALLLVTAGETRADTAAEYLADGDFHRLALPDPQTDPHGDAAGQALARMVPRERWGERVVFVADGAAALRLIREGGADAAVVPRPQGLADSSPAERLAVPEKLHAPLTVWAGSNEPVPADAPERALLAALADPRHADVWRSRGFAVPRPAEREGD